MAQQGRMTRRRMTRSSIRVARIGGIDIRVHWTFLVLLVLVAWADAGAPGTAGVSLVWIAAVFASVLVHEYAHCVVARRRGAVVEDILLLPIGGLSQMSTMPEAAGDELAIAIMGPLTSLGLAVLAAIGGLAVGAHLWPPTLFAGSWFARIAWLNALLGGFNLLPALPMDGGRVLRAALERNHDRLTATRQAGRIARILAAVMVAVGFFYDFWLVLIGLFVYMGATAEEQAAQTHGHGPAEPSHPAPHPPPPPPLPPPG